MGRPGRTGTHTSVTLIVAIGLSALGMPIFVASPAAALPTTADPVLTLVRTIRTTPYTGTSSSMRDGEGSAFVPNDSRHPNIGGTDSLWLAEDNGRAVWEVDPYTGALKSSIHDATWQATRQYSAPADTGTGATAGSNRDPDLESLAYDAASDTLYAFSGKCCTSSVLPTAYRLRRSGDRTFHPDSYQPLPSGSDYTAAAWHPGDRKVYVGVGSDVRTYDYPTNSPGSTFRISGVSGIFGMSFSADGNDLFVANSSVRLLRANWNTKALVDGWSIDLKPFGMKDSRAVELINDQFYILDGYDGRSSGDPLRYAVFVFDVCCSTVVAQYTVLVSAADAAAINSAADYFGIPRSEALITGARLMRYFDFLSQPAGLGPLTPPTPSTGPGSFTASYTDPAEVSAMQQLATRTGITVPQLHDIGVHLLVFLWYLSTN